MKKYLCLIVFVGLVCLSYGDDSSYDYDFNDYQDDGNKVKSTSQEFESLNDTSEEHYTDLIKAIRKRSLATERIPRDFDISDSRRRRATYVINRLGNKRYRLELPKSRKLSKDKQSTSHVEESNDTRKNRSPRSLNSLDDLFSREIRNPKFRHSKRHFQIAFDIPKSEHTNDYE